MRDQHVDSKGGALKVDKDKVLAWSQEEASTGHELCGDDLLDRFQQEVESSVFEMEKEEPAMNAFFELDFEQQEEEQALKERHLKLRQRLEVSRQFLVKVDETRQNACYWKNALCQHCNVVERRPDLVFPMTEEPWHLQ